MDALYYNKPISFIKLDVEGYEYSALLAAKNILTKHKPILCIERENHNIKKLLQNNLKSSIYLNVDLDSFYKFKINK